MQLETDGPEPADKFDDKRSAEVSLADPAAAIFAAPAAVAARAAVGDLSAGPEQLDCTCPPWQTGSTGLKGSPYACDIDSSNMNEYLEPQVPLAAQEMNATSSNSSGSRGASSVRSTNNQQQLRSIQADKAALPSPEPAFAAGTLAAAELRRGSEASASGPVSAAALRLASLKPSLALAGLKALTGTRTAADHQRATSFSPVCIVFMTVDGGSQLAAQPGGVARYLVRAQEGDLKYMAAFNSAASAAEWCMTVQEASLYLPYPQQLLTLSNFGVQLDAAGRLVFRGPRLKMGLCQGTPNCILPDFMGRADYHGPFVNQAARYADAAAHGGQVVADAETARSIFQHWNTCSSSVGSSGCLNSGRGSPRGRSSVAGGGPGTPSTAVQAAGSLADNQQLSASTVTDVAASLTAEVAVEGWWLGAFVYKGSQSPVEMVSLIPQLLLGRSLPAEAPSGKGLRVLQRVGVMDRAVVQLPAVVNGLWGN
eukprot:gene4238-4488_t